MLEDKLQFLIERGLLRKKHLQWIFKSDLIRLGEELQYRLELTMEEVRGPLYAALMQQSSALTVMYCATYRKPRVSILESISKQD